MIKMFSGGVGRVIIRGPARVRGQSAEFFGFAASWEPPFDPDTVTCLYVTNAGQIRYYWYGRYFPPDAAYNVADRLAHGTAYPGIRGGWLFNEQVCPRLYNVTLL